MNLLDDVSDSLCLHWPGGTEAGGGEVLTGHELRPGEGPGHRPGHHQPPAGARAAAVALPQGEEIRGDREERGAREQAALLPDAGQECHDISHYCDKTSLGRKFHQGPESANLEAARGRGVRSGPQR